MSDVFFVLDLPSRDASRERAEEFLSVLRVKARHEKAVHVHLAPDEELQVLDTVWLAGVVVRDTPANLDAKRV